MASHNELGKEGEQRACVFLEELGYTIVEKNWRYKNAEIDIIALFEKTLVIVEVKTRSSLSFGLPQDFVNKKKIKLLLQATNAYVDSFNRMEEVRFDIIAVHQNGSVWEIDHLKDAFYHF